MHAARTAGVVAVCQRLRASWLSARIGACTLFLDGQRGPEAQSCAYGRPSKSVALIISSVLRSS
eukprot:244869-Pelagomonas_calceolata.AAC.1